MQKGHRSFTLRRGRLTCFHDKSTEKREACSRPRGTPSHTKLSLEFGVVLGLWPKQTKLIQLLISLKEGQRKKKV
jgi:hypothetical protein